MRIKEWVVLAAFVTMSEAAGIVGSLFTFSAIDTWYATLVRPEIAPPNWVFGPVWTTLYFLMGVAAYMVWRNGFAKRHVKIGLGLFMVQLALNSLWSILFFGAHALGGAFLELVLLWCAILATIIAFSRISKAAALLLVPYIAWVSFAGYLNYSFWALNAVDRVPPVAAADCRNATFTIEGTTVTLHDGMAQEPAVPDSESEVVTRYFGNDVRADLNADGREDVACIITQQTGGSGTFFYAVAVLHSLYGNRGSDGYFLGDRIAPQATTLSQNPRQRGVVVFNYAERAPGAPMAAQPTVGKSVYLKLDAQNVQWGVVVPDFEGEMR